MGCVLRTYGSEFHVDRFLQGSSLTPYEIYRKGELRATKQEAHDSSGLKVEVSTAEFEDLQKQVADAIAFLKTYRQELERLRSYPGVEGASLDFALTKRDVFCQYDTLPAELLHLAGGVGLDIVLSKFAPGENEEEV